MSISVVVATRNRADDLKRLLSSLQGMRPPREKVEIVVADNGSTDATRETVEQFVSTNSIAYRYLNEPRRGKALALNGAVRAASGDVLAFVDDDIVVAETWAQEIEKAFSENARLAGLGGRVELFKPQDEKVTIRTRTEPALIELGSFTPLNPPILGCNMAFRAAVFTQIGLFDANVGPGSLIGSGDDLDFLYRALREKLEVRYLPSVLVYHNHGRSTPAQIQQLHRRYVKGRGAFYYKFARMGDRRVRKWATWEVRARMLGVLRTLFRPAEFGKSWRFLMDLAAGAAISRRIHSQSKSS